MRVTEIMRGNPICCVPSTSARKAAGIMRQFNTGILLVVETLESRKLVGVVTDRDLCVRVLAGNDNPAHTTVQDCMTPDVACCAPQDDIAKVLALMQQHHVRRVPVVNPEKKVEGLVTDRDLLENADINPHDLCVAMGRITASQIRTRTSESVTAFP